MNELSRVAIILVSPKGDANVGSVARAMANFGCRDLRLVQPRCSLVSSDCKMMAMKAYDIIEEVQSFSSLDEAQADLHWTAALSMHSPSSDRPAYRLHDLCERELPKVFSQDQRMGFVFGREEYGLHESELQRCDFQAQILTGKSYPSVNLAASVALVLHQAFLQSEGIEQVRSTELKRPKKLDEELYFDELSDLLIDIGFLNPQSPQHIVKDLRNMYHRSRMSERDLRILFGILSDLNRQLGRVMKKDRS